MTDKEPFLVNTRSGESDVGIIEEESKTSDMEKAKLITTTEEARSA